MEMRTHFGVNAKEKETKDDFRLLVSIDTSFGPEKSNTLSSLQKWKFTPKDFPICIISP